MSPAVSVDEGVSRPSRGRILWLIPVAVLLVAFLVEKTKEKGLQVEERNATFSPFKPPRSVRECVPPSIAEFPQDYFTQDERQRGYVLTHVLVMVYMCATLAIVCDHYFVPSLEVTANRLDVPIDVAGATFMAIGTSSPELYSAVIGSFVTEGDIGIGTIVGSAVFNILGVTSVTGLLLWHAEAKVDWYPISRDCLVYIFSVIALILVIQNSIVTWFEASLLVAMFGVYIAVMYYNHDIERSCTEKFEDLRIWWKRYRRARSNSFRPKRHLHATTAKCGLDKELRNGFISQTTDQTEDEFPPSVNGMAPVDKEDDKSDCSDMEEDLTPWSVPSESGFQFLWWLLMWPVLLALTLTIPNCRGPSKKFFPLTFLMSVLWIGAISYVCSWMVTIISYTFGLPDSVAGLTILAAGISVPEIIGSVIVVKNGMANMALCNLIGSNIFDILFCLGLPWLIKTLAFSRTGSLVINSAALTYTTATLLSTVILLFLILSISGWKLNFRVGVQCLVLYAAFLVVACMCELNVFGDMNPPTCPS